MIRNKDIRNFRYLKICQPTTFKTKLYMKIRFQNECNIHIYIYIYIYTRTHTMFM